MYPEVMVIPMREELTRAGLKEVRSAAEVDAAVVQPGTTMVVVNSICGCAAGKKDQKRSARATQGSPPALTQRRFPALRRGRSLQPCRQTSFGPWSRRGRSVRQAGNGRFVHAIGHAGARGADVRVPGKRAAAFAHRFAATSANARAHNLWPSGEQRPNLFEDRSGWKIPRIPECPAP